MTRLLRPAAMALAVAMLAPTADLLAQANPKPPTDHTRRLNAAAAGQLPFDDDRDFRDAQRGFIAPLLNDGVVRDGRGRIVFNAAAYRVPLDLPPPDSVHPSQWRQSQLNGIAGLFRVADRIYQVRGQDLANLTVIEGDTGLIVVDPLTMKETAAAAMELYFQNRPRRPVVAVIYTHSHADHFGGVRGVVNEEDVRAGRAIIVAPRQFTEEAVSENLMAGNAMSRRAHYQYGSLITPSPRGTLGSGLGSGVADGTVTLILPTHTIEATGDKLMLDGLEFEFLLAMGSEAPAEMHFFIPALRALCPAENVTHTLHNFYTLRGAKTRDARRWVGYLNETLDMWGDRAEVLFSPHHWPVWGNDRVVQHVENYRDALRYIHDQSLRLANHGYTMLEIGEMVELPPALAQNWATRGYYGSVSHNARAVYNFYLGYYSANPADLNPHAPADAAVRYVDAMGGRENVLRNARRAMNEGDYRWAAEVLKHAVYADPSDAEARSLQADAFEQLGYQSENHTWRNAYLSGAMELREGMRPTPIFSTASPDITANMPLDQLFDYLAIRLNGPRAANARITINFELTDPQEQYAVTLRNGVLNHRRKLAEDPDASVRLTREALNKVLDGRATLEQQVLDGEIQIDGDPDKLGQMLAMLDTFDVWFEIITPNLPPMRYGR